MATPQDILHELGDPTRLRVLAAILAGRKNVTQIVTELGLAQPQVSYHLRRLKDVGLAVEEKQGRWVFYQAHRESADAGVRSLLSLLGRWLEGSPIEAPAAPPVEKPAPAVEEIEDFLL